jgi:Na+/proline symporter
MMSLRIQLDPVDYLIVGSYFVFAMTVGILMKRRGGKSMRAYFLSNQKLSWFLLGTSMAATTFALDTPLRAAGWTRMAGISKNWEDWVFVFGCMFTTFFFAKLWRRSNVLNDAEFIHLRYSGKAAAFLRAFRALYMGFIMNMIVIGSQLLAIAKVGALLFGITSADPNYELWKWGTAIICGTTALFYCYLSGFGAIIITDFVQFFLSIAGAIFLAVFACNHPSVGGLDGLVEQLKVISPEKMNFMPSLNVTDVGQLSLLMVMGYACMRWWSQVYGGAEPGGQAHVAQRMLAGRTEKDSMLATLWFTFANFALKPLPWLITGLATILIFPLDQFTDHEEVYFACINFIPVGLRGITVASFFAAFMSTVDTRINLGASYFVNDFYKPFLAKDKSEDHYVHVSKLVSILQIIIGFTLLLFATNMRSVFFIYAGIGSGAGLVYILRFYWWRISAWSEISAMSAALICLIVFRWGVYGSEAVFESHGFEYMFISFFIVTAIWLALTFMTRPTNTETLKSFFRLVKPAGPFWKPISTTLKREEGIQSPDNLKQALIGYIFAIPTVLCTLFGMGNMLFQRYTSGTSLLIVAIICAFITIRTVKNITSNKVKEHA